MDSLNNCLRWPWTFLVAAGLGLTALSVGGADRLPTPSGPDTEYAAVVRPLLKMYCLECHSAKVKKGSLDLERFASLADVRKGVKRWEQVHEMLETEQMPPRKKPQPTADERQRMIAWVHGFLTDEARAHAGDPGLVPLRRLSNAEYDCTIRDLTGVDLRPTREFPADGAAGEGFTNAGEALSDISPTLLTKYFKAAKDIASHAVLLPDGFRFAPGKSRRDWTNESLDRLRAFYAQFTRDGRIPLQPYLTATLRHRDALTAGKTTIADVARQEKLNPKYLGILWQTLTDKSRSQPLDLIRAHWRQATEKDVGALAAEIAAWQSALWRIVPVGSYRFGNTVRQVASDPAVVDVQRLRLAVKPAPGQKEVVLYLVTRDASFDDRKGNAVWIRPRFEGAGKPPLLVGDYPQLAPIRGTVGTNSVIEVRLPASLFVGREFVVEGQLDGPVGNRIVQFQVLTSPPSLEPLLEGKIPVVASTTGASYKQMLQGRANFRRCFPYFICFPRVLPDDEVVCLKMYHREDEPLARLFLDDEQKRRIDHLWDEHIFVSRQPVAENNYLPLFIGFVTQDQSKEMIAYFESQREPFRKRAEAFEKDEEAAIPKQLDALLEFAGRAYRRPLLDKEKAHLLGLYQTLRKKGASHDEAFHDVLARVLAAPAFLFRIEQPPPGKRPGYINDWELATRLSYFLWSSTPDDELRRLAAAGKLRDPKVLAEQTRRMLKDGRLRALAIEFGTQWLHVRGFDEMQDKNEKLFPTFDANLRNAIYEESILFFQDLFQSDRAITQILDADYTFLNDKLAKHYGIPGVVGSQWRRVDGVKMYGRGGILGLASVQATQSGASRTSPTLRGNWIVETLLGEKLPRPPPNIPKLPEEEGGADHLTVRQEVEKHAHSPECAVCHQRIDPFGFALERYDAIGRWRDKDLGGLPIDSRSKLKDGAAFDGIDGLRNYLLTKKKDVIVRLFCRKLLGYALGRATSLSDQPLIDEMVTELNKNDGKVSAAVLTIVRSAQFRMIRGMDSSKEG